jgi:UDP-N-acetylglucosamine--N-acetylmuramyl-(pentapeptide) pyrophosphoryl-undecaprenol N-acetylglucosamine transferase
MTAISEEHVMRVVVAGGGSAGHIEPALALADALREADRSIQVTCLGTKRGLETRLVPMRGYDLELIPAVPLPRSVTPTLLTVPGRLAGAVHTTGQILDRVGADVLVGFGGYVATPAYLAAKRHKVPIVVHEANPFPGIANRLGAHLTTHVFTGHPDTKLRNARFVGLPIRRQIAELDRFALGDKARAHFGLRPDLPVLLVTGGSQGARALNAALAGAVSAIRNAGVQVLHVTGPRNIDEVQASPGAVPYVAVPFVDQMDLAYAAADFALCRAGAMTCAELTAVGMPAAYVPLPIGNGEQRLNALPIVQRGGGLLVEDSELSAEWIKNSLLPVLTNIDQVAAMSEAAAAMGRRDADRRLAQAVIDIVANERTPSAAEPGSAAEGQRAPSAGWTQSPRQSQGHHSQARQPQQGQSPQGQLPGGQPARGQSPRGQSSRGQSPQGQSPPRLSQQSGPQPPAGEPGSLFTPHSIRQQAAGGQQPGGQQLGGQQLGGQQLGGQQLGGQQARGQWAGGQQIGQWAGGQQIGGQPSGTARPYPPDSQYRPGGSGGGRHRQR